MGQLPHYTMTRAVYTTITPLQVHLLSLRMRRVTILRTTAHHRGPPLEGVGHATAHLITSPAPTLRCSVQPRRSLVPPRRQQWLCSANKKALRRKPPPFRSKCRSCPAKCLHYNPESLHLNSLHHHQPHIPTTRSSSSSPT